MKLGMEGMGRMSFEFRVLNALAHVSGLWDLVHHAPECGHMSPSPEDCAPGIIPLPDQPPEPRAEEAG
eukprot:gene18976-biopygen923